MNNWNNISSKEQVDEIIEASTIAPQIIFKHSTRCGISVSALDHLEKEGKTLEGQAFHYLDLLNHRDISQYIAQVLDVTHQSPQVLVIKNKRVVLNSTHYAIKASHIAAAL